MYDERLTLQYIDLQVPVAQMGYHSFQQSLEVFGQQ